MSKQDDKKRDSFARGKNVGRSSTVPAARDSIKGSDPLNTFLQQINRYPLLSVEDERRLAEEYQETKDANLAATLVTSNLRLVVKIAFEYRRAYRNIMDLIQEGNVGLMHAVKKYDPSKGVKLSSYAAWWIRAYILRFVLSNWRMVKLGTTQAQRKLFFNLNKEQQRLKRLGIEPTAEVLAERLQVKPKEIAEMEKRMQADDASLDVELGDSTGRHVTRGEMLPADGPLPDESVIRTALNDNLKFHMNNFARTLVGKEKTVYEERLMTDSPCTLREIGDRFSVSRERIRQVEQKVMAELREYLKSEMNDYLDTDDDD